MRSLGDGGGRNCVLVTGASGFIGSHLARSLLKEGYSVVAVVRKMINTPRLNKVRDLGGELVEGAFYDSVLLERVFREHRVTAVVHVAAVRGVGIGAKDDYHRVNVGGTKQILEACLNHNIKKFIFCSSVGVYGTIPSEVPASLQTSLHGDNEYHRSKVAGEQAVREFAARGLDAYIVRPTITYGEGDDGFPSMLTKLVCRRWLLLPWRDSKIHLVDVNKLCEVFLAILQAQGLKERIFLAADAEPVSMRELVNLISFHCRGVPYPPWLCLPDAGFALLLAISRVFKSSKWIARFSLLLRDWHYDIKSTTHLLKVEPVDTRDGFRGYLRATMVDGDRVSLPR